MVRSDSVCTEQSQHKKDCEILWVKVEVALVYPLLSLPRKTDWKSQSIEEIKKKAKDNIWLLGDFNLLKITWPKSFPPQTLTAPTNKYMTSSVAWSTGV